MIDVERLRKRLRLGTERLSMSCDELRTLLRVYEAAQRMYEAIDGSMEETEAEIALYNSLQGDTDDADK